MPNHFHLTERHHWTPTFGCRKGEGMQNNYEIVLVRGEQGRKSLEAVAFPNHLVFCAAWSTDRLSWVLTDWPHSINTAGYFYLLWLPWCMTRLAHSGPLCFYWSKSLKLKLIRTLSGYFLPLADDLKYQCISMETWTVHGIDEPSGSPRPQANPSANCPLTEPYAGHRELPVLVSQWWVFALSWIE